MIPARRSKFSTARTLALSALCFCLVGCQAPVSVEPAYSYRQADGREVSGVENASTSLYSQTFQSYSGTVEFHKMADRSIEVHEHTRNESVDFIFRANDPDSVYARENDGITLRTRLFGDDDSLTLSTQYFDVQDQFLYTINEIFEVSDNPCNRGYGRGLEVRQQRVSSESCQVYF